MDRARRLGTGAHTACRRTGCCRQPRLVTRGRRRLAGGRKKGGDLVGPSPVNRGFPSSKYHLAVDGDGRPLAVRVGPGNESERAHLLPLVDQLREAGYRPVEVWADRGYCSEALREALTERGISPQISRRRKPGSGPPPVATLNAGRRQERAKRIRDPLARHRWVVERTNAWLRRFRRLTIRTEPNSTTYLGYLTLALIIILSRSL